MHMGVGLDRVLGHENVVPLVRLQQQASFGPRPYPRFGFLKSGGLCSKL